MSLTRTAVLAILTKKHGRSAAARDSGHRSSADIRAYHKQQLAELVEPPREPQIYDKDLDPQMTLADFRALVKARRATRDEWRKARDHHLSGCHTYRYSVGTISDFAGLNAFHIIGQGDTWEAALQAGGYTLPTKRTTPTCKKCSTAHWPFQPCEA